MGPPRLQVVVVGQGVVDPPDARGDPVSDDDVDGIVTSGK